MRALILVDLQNDFLPGGALAVPHGNEVIPVANHLLSSFPLVVATQDWHPPHHASFAANHPGRSPGDPVDLNGVSQILWPVHCVQHSPGAALASTLQLQKISKVVVKGTDPAIDSYSGFFDNGQGHATGLGDYLGTQGVSSVYVLGLATEYCVKATELDARALGLATYVIADGCRGVELRPGDVSCAFRELRAENFHVIHSAEIFFAE